MRELRELGLSEYEALVYMTLLSRGELTPRKISEESGVPRTKVYEVLRRLGEKGWVVTISRKPLIYAPRKPAEILEEKKRFYEERVEKAKNLLEEVERSRLGLVPPAEILVIRRREALTRILQELLIGAKEEIRVLVTTPAMARFLEGVKRERVLRPLILAREGLYVSSIGEVKSLTMLLPLDMVISDKSKMVLCFGKMLERTEPRVYGVLISDPEIIGAVIEYFDFLWERAALMK